MGFLLDNILQQREAIRQMDKTPTKLACDLGSFDALMNELAPSLTYPSDPTQEMRVCGLRVEFTDSPNFEVV